VTDVLFAVDSIPAIFGITRDPFIVYTSSVCAILGLRSLYFLTNRPISRDAAAAGEGVLHNIIADEPLMIEIPDGLGAPPPS
jgi:hypothetical protein